MKYLIGIIFFSNLVFAETQAPNNFKDLFGKAKYQEAIESLKNIENKEFIPGQINYLTGLSYARMQEFLKAILYFQMAINEDCQNEDLYFELGQAYYASNELINARKAFIKSAELNFKKSVSLYYVAYISQMFEEYPEAKKNYIQILEMNDSDVKTRQSVEFQLAETMYAGFKSKTFKSETELDSVSKFVLPVLNSAYNLDPKSTLANDILSRIDEINIEYGLDPNHLINGRKLSKKKFSGNFNQKIKFDDNVTNASEVNNVLPSKKQSFVSLSEVYAKYEMVFDRKYIVSPDLRYTFVYYSNQSDQSVYQNDAYTINSSVKNQIEHTFNNLPASHLVNFSFSKTNKAWKQTHIREPYSTDFSLEVGEQFSPFSFGETTLKSKVKFFKGENKSISNKTYSFNGTQIVALKAQSSLIYFCEFTMTDNYRSPTSSTNSFLFRLDYIQPEIYPKFLLGLAGTINFTDTKKQKALRGIEVALTPSVDLSYNLNSNAKIFSNLEINKNFSKSDTYKYIKNTLTFGLQFNF